MQENLGRLAAVLRQEGSNGYRRYHLERIDGRLMLVRDELDRFFDLAMRDVFGAELEADDKHGVFLD
ncbi:hypothetical protein AYJ54_02725 [Bradyrhizobium centrolobii]|uniref:Uncharacterized protein n=1 Tax=Bradyrhizobium centrolobii TaxID=1505087 RepID=A0A176YJ04_9BRAD|nr:hypothetical protein [Bradyrhizobium centrolobii]OAF05819.1 hypothetical protein AYJ54_02725 [Bradyrhizobium centrolobii]